MTGPPKDPKEEGRGKRLMDEQDRQARRLEMLTWGFVVLGMVLRLFRYGRNFPLWGDEAFVAVNFIARGYRDLLTPLEYGQICPVLFLWIERFVVSHLGFSEWTLRLFPLVCGVSSVWLFRHVAASLVRGLPLALAVAIFAVSFHPVRHAAEVKPYASDLVVALVLLALALHWRRAPENPLRLWLLVAVSPVAVALSYPALFVAGGVGLSLAVPVWKQRRWRVWVPFLAFPLAVAGTFLGLYALTTRFQEQLALNGLQIYWAASFPPLDSPVRLLRWLITVHTGTMFAYPGGGRNGASTATLLAVIAGAIWLWRQRRRGVAVLLLTPFALALAAAALRRYPYGMEARQMQFVAPAICLLSGLGTAWLLQAIPGPRARRDLTALTLLFLAGFALVAVAGDLSRPYRYLDDRQARDFARRFWPEQARTAELACLYSDFGVGDRRRRHVHTALYLCNQWIYSPQRRQRGGPRWDQLSPGRPLRCMLFDKTRPEPSQVAAWRTSMERGFELRRITRIDGAGVGDQADQKDDKITLFEFVPRPGVRLAPPSLAGQGLLGGRLLR
jgi:hypothetical protein